MLLTSLLMSFRLFKLKLATDLNKANPGVRSIKCKLPKPVILSKPDIQNEVKLPLIFRLHIKCYFTMAKQKE